MFFPFFWQGLNATGNIVWRNVRIEPKTPIKHSARINKIHRATSSYETTWKSYLIVLFFLQFFHLSNVFPKRANIGENINKLPRMRAWYRAFHLRCWQRAAHASICRQNLAQMESAYLGMCCKAEIVCAVNRDRSGDLLERIQGCEGFPVENWE